MSRSRIPYPSIHRKEQWDRDDRIPWICVHWHTPNACQRVFNLDSVGGQVGSWHFRWPWVVAPSGRARK